MPRRAGNTHRPKIPHTDEENLREFDFLKEKASKEDADRLEQLNRSYCESTDISNCTNFAYGYRLGALMMIEVFTASDKLINNNEP